MSGQHKMTVREQAVYLRALARRSRMRDGSYAGQTILWLEKADADTLDKIADTLSLFAETRADRFVVQELGKIKGAGR